MGRSALEGELEGSSPPSVTTYRCPTSWLARDPFKSKVMLQKSSKAFGKCQIENIVAPGKTTGPVAKIQLCRRCRSIQGQHTNKGCGRAPANTDGPKRSRRGQASPTSARAQRQPLPAAELGGSLGLPINASGGLRLRPLPGPEQPTLASPQRPSRLRDPPLLHGSGLLPTS